MKHAQALSLVIAATGLLALGCAHSQKTDTVAPAAQSQPTQGDAHQDEHALHNLHKLNDDFWSASEPVGEAAYAELAAIGIKTVISVDGVAPNKELADRHGIQIVHLPIGYDGIDEQRSIELAHAMATMPRPIFVNCHHGKHRGPAALCVGAIGSGDISTEQALEFMKLAKTSPKYTGLWRAAETATPRSESELHNESIELPEKAVIEDFVEAMAEVDRLHEFLWECADNGFNAPEDHPDLAPISLAGQIHNLLRGMEDDRAVAEGGKTFHDMLLVSRDRALEVETHLEAGDIESALGSLELLTESCSACHSDYRNNI